jgi:hypothetical protein
MKSVTVNEHNARVRNEILVLFGIVEAGAGYNDHSQDFINECAKRMLQLEADNPLTFKN